MMSKDVAPRGVDPKYRKMAEEASAWASSEDGRKAFKRSVEAGHEGTAYLLEAERAGAERIGDRTRLIGIEPGDDSLGFLFTFLPTPFHRQQT
jgi:hypothetical protein